MSWVPLLIRHIQFSRAKTNYLPLYKAELIICGVFLMEEIEGMKCSELVKAIKINVYPEWDLLAKSRLTNNEKKKHKFFLLKYLTAFE